MTPISFIDLNLTQELFKEPVLTDDGLTYEKEFIEEWFKRGNRTSPSTNLILSNRTLKKNIQLENAISDFIEEEYRKYMSSFSIIATLTGHKNMVWSVAFHPTRSLLATGSWDNTVKLWQLSSDNSSATYVATLEGHSDYVYSVAFHPTKPLLATGSYDKTAKLWQLPHDNSSSSWFGLPSLTQPLRFSGQSKYLIATLKGHTKQVNSVAFHPMFSFMATGSTDNSVRLWKLTENSSVTLVATLTEHSNIVSSVAFHPAQPLLASGSYDNTVKLWLLDDTGASCVKTLDTKSGMIYSIAFHPTLPLLATGGGNKTAKLWRLSYDNSSGYWSYDIQLVVTLEGHSDMVHFVIFHPKMSLLATVSDNTTKLWLLSKDNRSASCVATLVEPSGLVSSAAFHPTLPLLITGCSDYTAKLWRIKLDYE
jgi:WD40 repeat protein